MQDQKYNLDPNNIVHETELFAIDVGPYPGEELDCYRIFNKQYMVLEYAHNILFYALQWANSATKILKDDPMDQVGLEEELPDVKV